MLRRCSILVPRIASYMSTLFNIPSTSQAPRPGGYPNEQFTTRILPAPLAGVRFPHPTSAEAQDPQFPSEEGQETHASVREAAEELRSGGVVAFPTETV